MLIDHDRRVELLSEQDSALAEAADLDAQLRVGRLLLADWLFCGNRSD